jgi:thymidylate kinase
MLIIEGADHVGKTTFAKKLEAHPRMREYGMLHQPLSRLPDSFHRYWGYEQLAWRNRLCDRFHMSEVVYSHARDDDETTLTPGRYRLVDAMVRLRAGFTVVITCESDVLQQRLHGSPKDEMYSNALILKANEAFRQIATHRELTYDGRTFYEGIDVDAHIRCDRNTPYPTEHDVRNVVAAYERRRDAWDDLMRERGNRS